MFSWTVEHEEAAATRAENLAAARAPASMPCSCPAIYTGVGHFLRALFLGLPVAMHQASKAVQVSLYEGISYVVANLFDLVQAVDHRAVARLCIPVLLEQDVGAFSLNSGENH